VIGIDVRTIPAQRHGQLRKQLESLLGRKSSLAPVVDSKACAPPKTIRSCAGCWK